jgi:flagellar motor switch/type III secretory pathway protein FliN
MGTALAVSKELIPIIPEEFWTEVGVLPCVLSVDLRPNRFTVRDLLRLEAGSIVESNNANGADVPLVANAQLIGWAEFEVVGQKLAVRITGIA